MQLGSRWRVGDPPHSAVPVVLHTAIAASETEHTSGSSWTLTWLEGRARVELMDAGALVLCDLRVDAAGQVQKFGLVEHSDMARVNDFTDDDNEDDDWLK
ncbi:MAG: Fe-S oxidoreductase [Leucobacter sp.]